MRGSCRALAAGLAAIVTLSFAVPAFAQRAATPQAMDVVSRPITQFHIGRPETRFGQLEFVGGLEMTSRGRHFGSFSAFRFLEPGSAFIGVADTGFWFFGSVERDAAGKPTGFTNFRMAEMVDDTGRPRDKQNTDAEGLAVRDGVATVSFERIHRVSQYAIATNGAMGPPLRDLPFLIPPRELRQNRGLETIAHAHPYGIHEGGLVVVSEKSLDPDGNIFAAIIEGPDKGIFKVKRHGEYDVTDGAFLPNGDLLLLERAFSISQGIRMRLRRIEGETIRKGALADGPILLDTDMSYQIDNMEGLDVWTRADGALMVSIVSDDNHSILQRNLYLEFRLHD